MAPAKKSSEKPRRVLSVFVLIMLNVSIMASLRSLPLVASYGLSVLTFFALVGLFFLLPSALISAELATGWPKEGGVYIWIREALGDRWGFFAIWMQWVHNVAWYPVILSFVATTLAFVIDPALVDNKYYIIAIVLGCFWGMTLLNYLGIKTSSYFSTFGVICGTILPGIFIIALGVTWLIQGRPIDTSLAASAILPDLTKFGNLAFLAGLFLAFAGLEVSAAHAGEVRNPLKNFPRAILCAALITFFLFLLGALSIAFVIPHKEINLVAGLMDAFKVFFGYYNLDWVLPIIGILLIIGAVAEVNAWIVGPVKGLYATSIHGNLPPMFQKLNKYHMPTNLLLLQAIIVSVASFAFLELPTISAGFWILSALSAQTYLLMYILMFIAAIRLRYTKPKVPRPYQVPYKFKGIWVLSLMGIIGSSFAIFFAFFPPTQIEIGSVFFYESFLIIGLLIMSSIPLIIYQFRKPHWVKSIT